MSWVRVVPPEEAEGRLAELYDASIKRAGRVFHIVRSMSLAPRILESSFDLYQKVMYARPGLARYQREMLAVVVSRTNDCHY